MNIKEVLSENEEIIWQGQQNRLVPGGKELLPGKLAVTNQRIILETTSFLGIKKNYEDVDLPYKYKIQTLNIIEVISSFR